MNFGQALRDICCASEWWGESTVPRIFHRYHDSSSPEIKDAPLLPPNQKDREACQYYRVGDAVTLTDDLNMAALLQGFKTSWGIVSAVDAATGWITLVTGTSPTSVRQVPATGIRPLIEPGKDVWCNSSGKCFVVVGTTPDPNPWHRTVKWLEGDRIGMFDMDKSCHSEVDLHSAGMKRPHGDPQLSEETDDRKGRTGFTPKPLIELQAKELL